MSAFDVAVVGAGPARGLEKAAVLLIYAVARRGGDPGREYRPAPV